MNDVPLPERIELFLDGQPHAVVGASTDRSKYGNKVLRAYLSTGRPVVPINPTAKLVEGLQAFGALDDVPTAIHGISVVTPPAVTEHIVKAAIDRGIKHIWLQPGSFTEAVVATARTHQINLIAGDACILVVLGYSEPDE